MGRAARTPYLPRRLGEKLLQIRRSLNLTQTEMLRELNSYGEFSTLTQNVISDYEKNRREPAILVLYAYARRAAVPLEALVDDELEL